MLTDLIHALATNPRMFTMGGTFAEVSAWLQGYSFQMRESNAEDYAEWTKFKEWLVKRLDYPSNYVWCAALWRTYPDDKEALAKLRAFYSEFVSTR